MSSEAIDDLQIRLAPVMLAAGVRLFEFEFDGVEATRVGLERDRLVDSPAITHLYRLVRWPVG
jgi:hypothetical protein